MVRATKWKGCPPGIPKSFLDKEKKLQGYKVGQGTQEEWREVFRSASKKWFSMTTSQRKPLYPKKCFEKGGFKSTETGFDWTGKGKAWTHRDKDAPKKKKGVKKTKGKGKKKAKGKTPRNKMTMAWMKTNCLKTYKELKEKNPNRKYVTYADVLDACSGDAIEKFEKAVDRKGGVWDV